MTRWMHPAELQRPLERVRFDPQAEGIRYGLPRDVSLAIWERACADATDRSGRCNEHRARQQFSEFAARLAADGRRYRPEPGKVTRVAVELGADSPGSSLDDVLQPRVPGRETLAAIETRQWMRVDEVVNARLGFDDYRVLGLDEVLRQLGPDHRLKQDTIAATAVADRPIAGRATRWRESLPKTATPDGHAVWRAAERHAVTLYRRAVAGDGRPEDPAVELALQRIGAGQPLPATVRRTVEQRLGVALDRVRVHTDAVACEAARALRAEAFTVGDDIFFAEHAFAPDTEAGMKLLVHELAHVVQAQQRRTESGSAGLRISHPHDHLEREAEALAVRFGSAPDTAVHGAEAAPSEQHQPEAPGDGAEVEAARAADAKGRGTSMGRVMREPRDSARRMPDKRTRTAKREPRIASRAIARDARSEFEDRTTGLTQAQKGTMSRALGWCDNLIGFAVKPPQWDLMLTQCDQIVRDVGDAVAKATSLARGKAEPAASAASQAKDTITGAKAPLTQAAQLVAGKLLSAQLSLEAAFKPNVMGGVDMNDLDTFDQKVEEARTDPEHHIPGTPFIVLDEAKFRAQFQPLDSSAKQELIIPHTTITQINQTDLSKRPPDLQTALDKAQSMKTLLDSFKTTRSVSTNVGAAIDKAAADVSSAIDMLIGKLAPVENVLAIVRRCASEAKTAINATLALPARHDPSVPGDPTPASNPSPAALDQIDATNRKPPAKVTPHRDADHPFDEETAHAAIARAAAGAGAPLPEAIRRELERAMGVDLGSVRVHTGGASETAADAIQANAYTVGQDIHFAAGRFDPSSHAGRRLIAHEVVHAVQQRGAGAPSEDGLEVSQRGDPAEVEAEGIADDIVAGWGTAVVDAPAASGTEIAREPTDKPDSRYNDDDLSQPAESNPNDLWFVRKSLADKTSQLWTGGCGVKIAHKDMLAMGFTLTSRSHPRSYKHPSGLVVLIMAGTSCNAPAESPRPPEPEPEPAPDDDDPYARATDDDNEALKEARGVYSRYAGLLNKFAAKRDALGKLRDEGKGQSTEYAAGLNDLSNISNQIAGASQDFASDYDTWKQELELTGDQAQIPTLDDMRSLAIENEVTNADLRGQTVADLNGNRSPTPTPTPAPDEPPQDEQPQDDAPQDDAPADDGSDPDE